MATHHVMIDGTSYAVGGGTALTDGTKYQIGGGTTLIDGTAYQINFAPSEYIMTLTGSGGTITYNGVTQTTTFRVAVGDSIVCTAHGIGVNVTVAIYLNNTVVASKRALRTASVSYTYTPTSNAIINRVITNSGNNTMTKIKITDNNRQEERPVE